MWPPKTRECGGVPTLWISFSSGSCPKANFSLRNAVPWQQWQCGHLKLLREICPSGKGGPYYANSVIFPPPFLWPLFSMSPSMQSCITVPVVKALKETQLSGWRTRKGSPGKLESMRENLWRRDQKKVIPNPMYKPTQTPNSLSHAAHVQMCSNSVEKAAHRRWDRTCHLNLTRLMTC